MWHVLSPFPSVCSGLAINFSFIGSGFYEFEFLSDFHWIWHLCLTKTFGLYSFDECCNSLSLYDSMIGLTELQGKGSGFFVTLMMYLVLFRFISNCLISCVCPILSCLSVPGSPLSSISKVSWRPGRSDINIKILFNPLFPLCRYTSVFISKNLA